jgi:hypothetical protein
VKITFNTHNDNKNAETILHVFVKNRSNTSSTPEQATDFISASSSQDIAIGLNLLQGQEFPDPSTKTVVFSTTPLPLASNSIRLQDIVLPVVFINITPHGNARWNFDYRVTYTFSNGQTFSSQTNGIILDQNNHKHVGVYQGSPFPTVAPPGKPQLNVHDHGVKSKVISLSFLRKKLDEFINNRQGVGSQDPPIRRLRLDNAGVFGDTFPESYYDLQSLVADPPPQHQQQDTHRQGRCYSTDAPDDQSGF